MLNQTQHWLGSLRGGGSRACGQQLTFRRMRAASTCVHMLRLAAEWQSAIPGHSSELWGAECPAGSPKVAWLCPPQRLLALPTH